MTSKGDGRQWLARRSGGQAAADSSSSGESSRAARNEREQADLPMAGAVVVGPEMAAVVKPSPVLCCGAAPTEQTRRPADWNECSWRKSSAGIAAGRGEPDSGVPTLFRVTGSGCGRAMTRREGSWASCPWSEGSQSA